MKVVFCWPWVSGYMAAGWRRLIGLSVDVHVIVPMPINDKVGAFDVGVMDGISHEFLTAEQLGNQRYILKIVVAQQPDIVFLPGWFISSFRALPFAHELNNVCFIAGVDTPFRNDIRQFVGRFLLRTFLSRLSAVVVPGERAWQYARYLRVPEEKTYRGLYGIDYERFGTAFQLRQKERWPRRFLYVGRYVESKGVDVLVAAYRKYRKSVGEPWALTCCGTGRLSEMLDGEDGITDVRFVLPADLPTLFAQHGALVLPSRFDPWPLVVGEGCAAGLPVLCTGACGSSVELVRHLYNGYVCTTGNADDLAEGMLWLHQHEKQLNLMGGASHALAAPYDAQVWAGRMKHLFEIVMQQGK